LRIIESVPQNCDMRVKAEAFLPVLGQLFLQVVSGHAAVDHLDGRPGLPLTRPQHRLQPPGPGQVFIHPFAEGAGIADTDHAHRSVRGLRRIDTIPDTERIDLVTLLPGPAFDPWHRIVVTEGIGGGEFETEIGRVRETVGPRVDTPRFPVYEEPDQEFGNDNHQDEAAEERDDQHEVHRSTFPGVLFH